MISFYNKGELQEALNRTTNLLRIFPRSIPLYNISGAVNTALRRYDEAIKSYSKTLEIKTDYAVAHNNIGTTLKAKGDFESAIKSYKSALKINPKYSMAYNNLGVLLSELGDIDAAIQYYRKAIKMNPNYATAYNNLGVLLKDRGETKKAIANYNIALKIKPDYAEAHRNLSLVKKYKTEDSHFLIMKNFLGDKTLTVGKRCQLCFALSKAFADLRDYSNSFSFLKEGNDLRKKLLSYSIDDDIKLFEKIKRAYLNIRENASNIEKSYATPRPIFILGMPRSGTTLVEQIVSSHSEVIGAGELNYIELLGSSIARGSTKASNAALRLKGMTAQRATWMLKLQACTTSL